MRYDPERHHRRSIRLKGYDYGRVNAYFVTICIWQRECLLGEIVGETMVPSVVGDAVKAAWDALPERFPTVTLDALCLMPNHIHGILCFTSADAGAFGGASVGGEGAASSAPTGDLGGSAPRPTLGGVLRAFKSLSAIQANRLLGREQRPFWQRNYYERIVRNDNELHDTRHYIVYNHLNWQSDDNHPNASP